MMTLHNEPLRAAVIGYGLAGAVFHAPLIAATPGMQVAAVVTSNTERQQMARKHYPAAAIFVSTDELWNNSAHYDLAVIATPNKSHVQLGLIALKLGLPVVIDKPIATSVADAERLLTMSEQTGKLLTVFQNCRWDGYFMTVRKLIEADMLGTITRYEAHYERYRPTPLSGAWRELADPSEAGGQLYDLGSHLIDQCIQLFGKPIRVYAELNRRRPNAQVDDDTFVALEFANGVNAHLYISMVARIPSQRVRVLGLRGTYEKWGADPQKEELIAGMRPGEVGWGIESREHWGRLSTEINNLHFDGQIETLPGAYDQYYVLLRDALIQGSPPPVDPRSSIEVLRVIEDAKQSTK